jgi:phosphate uptake regulator
MTPLEFFTGRSGPRIEAIETTLKEMLERDRKEVDLAMSVLLGERVPEGAAEKVRSTDRKVNKAERAVRREIVVHASVFGNIEIPSVLLYMSIVKDIERIGDYAKNLIDLALDGVTFGNAPDVEDWRKLGDEISLFIAASTDAFHERDGEATRDLIAQGDRLCEDFDRRISDLVRGEDDGPHAVARALALRYLKRVVAHLMNVLSGVLMPLDRLDYYDEDKETRE